ncbi:MAG: MFS transporter [Deltaproteobacteria bacterium]|nr:MFS transporter [Deltaproteobacteria bacterium]
MNTVQRSALTVATISSFITPFMISSVNVALPAIEEGFLDQGINAVLLSWVATSYLLAAGVSLVPMGRFADIVGRKKILGLGFLLFSLSSLLCALSPNVFFLLLFRVLQGFGGGMIFSTGMAILTSVFPPHQRGKVLGLAVTAVYIGLLTGPFLGGLLTHYFGWRSLFVVIFFLGVIPPLLIVLFLKGEWADAAGESYDWFGALLYIPSLVSLIYGFSTLKQRMGLLLLVAGCAGLAAFVYRQRKIREPLFQVNLFISNRVFALSNAAALIHYSATFGLTFLLSFYLQYIKGLDPRMTGIVLIAQPVTMALFSPLAGRMSDRIEPRIISSIGMAITFGGLFYFSFLGLDTSVYTIAGVLLFLGFGFALFSSPNMNAIMGSVEPRYLGIAAGSSGTMRVLGQVLSMGIATLILSVFMGERAILPDLYPLLLQSICRTFSVFSALCIVGIFASLARGDLHASG